MSYGTYSQHEGQKSTIEPYYKPGDVFQRDERYYEQAFSWKRNRTPNKSMQGSNVYKTYGNQSQISQQNRDS